MTLSPKFSFPKRNMGYEKKFMPKRMKEKIHAKKHEKRRKKDSPYFQKQKQRERAMQKGVKF
jgi:hypothetical protein